MAITVTQRPSTTISGETSKWNAVNNPVIYKMTTDEFAEDNYRLEVEVYDGANTLLTAEPFQYTPNSTGALTIDISAILRNNLSADFDGDLSGSTQVFDDTNTYIKFYIKYQEFWDGSAEAQVSDSANQFYAVNGELKIPSAYGGNMALYVSFDDALPANKFLTKFTSLRMWRSYPCLLSVIVGENVTTDAFVRTDLSADSTSSNYSGKLITVDLNQIITDQTADTNNARLFKSAGASLPALNTWVNVGSGTNWTTGSAPTLTLSAVFAASKFISGAYATITGGSYNINYNIDVTDANSRIQNIDICIIDGSGNILDSTEIYNVGGTGNYTGSTILVPPSAGTYIAVRFSVDDGGIGSGTVTINSITRTALEEQISETLPITLHDACDNAICLIARNTLGGEFSWVFDIDQEYTFEYGDNRKAARKVLKTENLTLNEWEALQDFISLGSVYRNNIVEFTSSTIKTSTRIGQQVYVIDEDGNEIGVIVIPSKNNTRTRQVRHSFELEIEYPE